MKNSIKLNVLQKIKMQKEKDHQRAFNDITSSYALRTDLKVAKARCILIKAKLSVKGRDCKAEIHCKNSVKH